jgi:hypothetical protein
MHQDWREEETRLLDVWLALRRTALRKPTAQNQEAADAAFRAYRDHLLSGIPHQPDATPADGAVTP